MNVTCPYCKRDAELVRGCKVYPHRPDLAHKKYWRCVPCDAYVGCHPRSKRHGHNGDEPMGRLANVELRRAKQRAHAVFDPFWKSRDMKRTEAYAWLAEQMGVSAANCHIGMFDVDGCRAVVAVVENYGREA